MILEVELFFLALALLGAAGLLFIGAGGRLAASRRPTYQKPADESIPSQAEMAGLYKLALAGDQAAAAYWLRGAVYYHSQDTENGGLSAPQALAAALDPDLQRVFIKAE